MYDYNLNIELKYFGIIDRKQFSVLKNKKKYEYLIDKNIIIKDGITKQGDNANKKFEFTDIITFEGNYYSINPDITNEFYSHLDGLVSINSHTQHSIDAIKSAMFCFSSVESKIELLSKELSINESFMSKHNLGGLFLGFTDSSFHEMNWKEFTIFILLDDFWKYLIGKDDYFFHTEHFKDWCELDNARGVIDYCKQEINKLSKKEKEKEKEKRNTKNFADFFLKDFRDKNILNKEKSRLSFKKRDTFTSKDSAIFKENGIEIFYWILEKTGAYSGEEYKKRKIKPICDAIFTFAKGKNVILKKTVERNEYINFLKSIDIDIPISNRISSGIKYVDYIREIYDDFIKEQTK